MKRIAVAAVLAAGAVLNLALSTHDQPWGDDFAEYVQHARNVATGRPYGETTWQPRPEVGMAPREYPPGFPLLIAPVYKVAGLDFRALKVVPLVSWSLALLCFAALLGPRLSTAALTGWALLCVVHPATWLYAQTVLSDTPFMMWCGASLLCLERLAPAQRHRAAWGVAAGTAIGAAVATRITGLALLPVPLLYDWVRFRRIRGAAVLATVIALCVTAAELRYAPGQLQYLSLHTPVPPFPQRIVRFVQLNVAYAGDLMPVAGAHHGQHLVSALRSIAWEPLWGTVARFGAAEAMVAILLAMTAWGFWNAVRRQPSAAELFVPLYAAIVVCAPVPPTLRYLVPIVPLLFGYLMSTMAALPIRRPPVRIAMGTAAVAVLAGMSVYSIGSAVPEPSITAADTQALFRFVRTLPPGSMISFAKPRALALMTGRRTCAMPWDETDDGIRDYLDRAQVTYLAVADTGDPRTLQEFAERHPREYEQVFAAGLAAVFHRRP